MTRYYWGRLLVGMVAAVLACACSAILDTNELQKGSSTDGPINKDIKSEVDQEILPDILPGDLGSCKPGESCKVGGAYGLCAVGEAKCNDAGTGVCEQTVQPTTEKCDGKDSDCDNAPDKSDGDAHAWCGTEHPNRADKCGGSACKCGDQPMCDTGLTCQGGQCLCGTTVCDDGHTCVSGTCKCGTNPKCAQPNPTCDSGQCICDADSTCKDGEKCDGGKCNCGTTAGPAAGPFCTAAGSTCNAQTGQCEGPSPDSGPDGPIPDGPAPDVTPDMPLPDTTSPDTTAWPDLGVDQGADQGADQGTDQGTDA